MELRWRGVLVCCAAGASACALAFHPADAVLYNHSPSVPVGFYVRNEGPAGLGAFVTIRARDAAPELAHVREFDDANDRFIKRVAAVGGHRVCGAGNVLSVDGEIVAQAHDSMERLRIWSGCRRLRGDEVLLLGDTPDSFDGRYWGPVSVDLIEGVWRRF